MFVVFTPGLLIRAHQSAAYTSAGTEIDRPKEEDMSYVAFATAPPDDEEAPDPPLDGTETYVKLTLEFRANSGSVEDGKVTLTLPDHIRGWDDDEEDLPQVTVIDIVTGGEGTVVAGPESMVGLVNGGVDIWVQFDPAAMAAADLSETIELAYELEFADGAAPASVTDELLHRLIAILADTNRDGDVDLADLAGRSQWSQQLGAIYAVNFDSDGDNAMGGVPMPDAVHFGDDGEPVFEHYKIVNAADQQDIAPLVIMAMPELPDDYQVFLRVDHPETTRSVHLFKKIEADESAVWGSLMEPAAASPAAAPWLADGPDPADLELDISRWVNENHPAFNPAETGTDAEGNFIFGIEGLVLRGMQVPGGKLDEATGYPEDAGAFSGEILFHLEVRDPNDDVVAYDSVRLRVAPWLALSHQEEAEQLYIGDMGAVNSKARNEVLNGRYVGLHHTGIMNLIDYDVSQWLQDHVEIGYTQRPGGPATYVVFRKPYRTPLPLWPLYDLLGPDMAVFQLGAEIWDPSEGHNGGGDFGGNLETLPPTSKQPFGVIIMGDSVSAAMRRFIRAQEVQHVPQSFDAPASWLWVGHIDEVTSFLSDRRILIASSRLGIETLENEIPANERHLRVFFATDSEVIAGELDADTPGPTSPIINTGRDHLIEGDGVDEDIPGLGVVRVGWIRFYSGNARGQVAKVRLFDGHAEVLIEASLEPLLFPHRWALWDTGISLAAYRGAKGEFPLFEWDRTPASGDEFVLVAASQRWAKVKTTVGPFDLTPYNGMPAVITVEEILADPVFKNLNRYHAQREINDVESAIRAAGGGAQHTHFIAVPALYFGQLDLNDNVVEASAYAFNPGPTNLQPVAGNLYVHRQFGPVNAAGEDIYEEIIKNSVQETVFFVDGWDAYHVNIGEIHCGTNVTRVFPDQPWWENLENQQP